MFCPKCGTQLPDDAVFCGKCGTGIRMQPESSDPERSRAGRPAYNDEEYGYPGEAYAYPDDDDWNGGYEEGPDLRRTGKKQPRKKSRMPLVLFLLLLLFLAAAAFLFWQLKSRQAETGSGASLQAADEPMKTAADAAAVTPAVTAAPTAELTPEAAVSLTPVPTVSAAPDLTAAATPAPTAAATPAPTAAATPVPTATPTPTPIPEPAPSRLAPAQITATSELGYDGDNYFPEYVNDGNPVTAWAEGVPGNGEGQSLFFTFPAGTKLTGCEVMPGFFKNDDLFSKNSAPSALLISTGGSSVTADVSEYANSWHGSSSLQTVTFSTPLICDGTVTVSIQAVRGGWKYTDTLISELHFFGVSAQYVSTGATDPSGQQNGADSAGEAGQTSGDSAVRTPEEEEVSRMASLAGWVYRRRMGQAGAQDADIREEELTADEKAFLLYWYQYHGGDRDSRIQSQMEYNAVSAYDLLQMLCEITGEPSDMTEETMNAFYSRYVQMQEGDTCYMYGTGDFGDAGPFYFGDGQQTVEDGRICISGSVMVYDSGAGTYVPAKTYRAYYSTENGESGNPDIPYPFSEVVVTG